MLHDTTDFELIKVLVCCQNSIYGMKNKELIEEFVYNINRHTKIIFNRCLCTRFHFENKTNDSDSIFKKISECDFFICDITPVSTLHGVDKPTKLMPDSNVLLALGYALCYLPTDRIFPLMMNPKLNKQLRFMPFDIVNKNIYLTNINDDDGFMDDFQRSVNNYIKESRCWFHHRTKPIVYEKKQLGDNDVRLKFETKQNQIIIR